MLAATTPSASLTVIEFCDLLSVRCVHPPLLGSSYPPCVLNTPRSARVPHRSGPLRQSWASAGRAKPEPSVDLGSGAQTSTGEVLRRVHRQIQIGASRRRSCLVHRVACEAFVHEDGLPLARRMERRELGINRERGPPLGWRVLHRQTDNLVGPLHDWDG